MGSTRRALLVQFRRHQGAERQERECFARLGGLDENELAVHNVAREPELDWPRVAAFPVLLLGGAGEFSATGLHAFTPWVLDVLARCADDEHPVLGSCFGHHLMAQVRGGEVRTDPVSEEVGTFDVTLTSEGRQDPLTSALPERFSVQLGHHDRVTDPGDDMVELATSDACRHQVLRLRDRPFYSTQFHAELDEPAIRARLQMYREDYLPGASADQIGARLRPSPHAPELLRRFLLAYC